jgi:hypothetical protein
MIQTFSRLTLRIGPVAQRTDVGLCFLLCLIGCTSANVNSSNTDTFHAPQAAATARSRSLEVIDRSRWEFEEVSGERTPVLVSLPKAGHWQVEDQKTTWWVAANAELGMSLEAKLWPERRLVTWQDCLEDLGRWRNVSGQSMVSNALQSRDMKGPSGFSSHLLVTVNKGSQAHDRTGTAVLVGADIARCFAFWVSIETRNQSNEDELLARMALVTEGILPKIRLRSVEQRIDDKVKH